MYFCLAASQLKFPILVQNIFHQSKNNVVLSCIFYVGEHGAAIFILKNEKENLYSGAYYENILMKGFNLLRFKLKPFIKRVQNL